MTPDPYQSAYEKAIEDLTQISYKFEHLTSRKKLVENLLAALQPISAGLENTGHESTSLATIETSQNTQQASTETSEAAEPEAGYSFLDVPAPLPSESDGDPFQRRVRGNFRFKGFAAAQRSH